MMKVKFLVGYRGWITGERHYPPGTVCELDEDAAVRLIDEGRAELYQEKPGPVEATPSATKFAVENNINLARVVGSGTDGRILVGDVKAYLDG